MTDPMAALIATRYLRGLRVAVVVVLGVLLLGWQLPTAIGFAARYRPAWVEFAALAVLALVNLVAAVVVLADLSWGRARWPLLGAALAASVLATAAVARHDLFGPPHWSWEIFGWYAVILLMDLPAGWFAAVLGGYLAITVGQALLAGQRDTRVLVGMAISTLVLAGWQFAVTLGVASLRRTALAADRIAAEEEELRTAERVAEQVHDDRKARYGDLLDSTIPLLTGLAERRLHPDDPQVQHACIIEAARMRRLFAESDDVGDPLRHELEACIDSAERRGVAVQLALRGERPALPLPVRRALTEPVIAVLAGAREQARVTVVGLDGEEVVVSVVSDQVAAGLAERIGAGGATSGRATTDDGVTLSWLPRGAGVWLDATWKRSEANRD